MQDKHLTKKQNKKYYQGVSLFTSATTLAEVNQLKRVSITQSEKLTQMFFCLFQAIHPGRKRVRLTIVVFNAWESLGHN